MTANSAEGLGDDSSVELRVQRDSANDMVYIALSASACGAGAAKATRRVDDDIALDFDADGRLLGLEIMNASRRLVLPAS